MSIALSTESLAACGFSAPATPEATDRILDALTARLERDPESPHVRAAISALGRHMRNDLEQLLRDSTEATSLH